MNPDIDRQVETVRQTDRSSCETDRQTGHHVSPTAIAIPIPQYTIIVNLAIVTGKLKNNNLGFPIRLSLALLLVTTMHHTKFINI